jgi:hypothetical protein
MFFLNMVGALFVLPALATFTLKTSAYVLRDQAPDVTITTGKQWQMANPDITITTGKRWQDDPEIKKLIEAQKKAAEEGSSEKKSG